MKALAVVDGIVARCERVVAVGLLAATVTIVVLQVFFRYVLNSSLGWSEEVARYLFIWAAVLGFSSSVEARKLFSFELVFASLPPAGKTLCRVLYAVAVIAFVWVLVVHGATLVQNTFSQSSPAVGVPMALPYAALPAGGLLVGFHFLAALGAPRRDAAE